MGSLNRFNWIASHYDRLVKLVFGSTLLNAQLTFIDSIRDNDSILILGGGSGEFLHALLDRKPGVTICYIEASKKMLELSKSRVSKHHTIDFIHGTEDDIPDSDFNVVITNFFLDLFSASELKVVVEKINKRLTPDGKWIVTDFENSPRVHHRIVLSAMYLFFRITNSIDAKKLSDWRFALTNKELYPKEERIFRRGFVKSTLMVKPSV
jgi:tRNA (cmo5U34)-methyltransferase